MTVAARKKVVLITGGSSGFGKLTAKTFHRQGWQVIATMRTPEQETELNKLNNLLLTRLDVTDQASIHQAITISINKFKRIDALVNNAGYGVVGHLEEFSTDEIQKQISTNFIGVVNTIREVLPYMRQQRGGRIINITSIAGMVGLPYMALYNASKHAVEGLSESLNYELKQWNIRVKTIAPGAFKTGFSNAANYATGNLRQELNSSRQLLEKKMKLMLSTPPKPFGYGNPQSVANAIYYAATRNYTTVRTLVGKDAKILSLLKKILPKKMFFSIIEHMI